jgi:hypothetical protein
MTVTLHSISKHPGYVIDPNGGRHYPLTTGSSQPIERARHRPATQKRWLRALRKLDDDVLTPPRRDLRSMGDLVAELCLLPHGFVRDSESRVSDDGFAISLATHPPTDERIDALQSLASEQEA